MKQIKNVFAFELRSILSKKSVIITTVLFAAVFFIATSIPTIVSLFDNDDVVDETNQDQQTNNDFSFEGSGFYFESNDVDKFTFVSLGGKEYQSADKLREDVANQEISAGFIITSPTSFDSIVLDRSWVIFEAQMVSSYLQSIQIDKNLIEADLDPQTVSQAMNVTIDSNEIVLGRDSSSSFFVSFILMFAVYMLVIMYGSFVSTSVAREKDNRTMEILITATKPSILIIGKVFANAVAGLAQFGFVAIFGLLGFIINQNSYPQEIVDGLFGGLSMDGLLIFLMFTVFGYILYLFIYASLGSLVSKIEDVSSSVTPITLLFIVAYGIAAVGMEAPNTLLVKVSSFVPFSSILTMPVRYFQMSVPWYELAISMVLMLLTTLFFAYVSIKIYRMGSLNYGNKIKLSKAIKMIFSEK